MSEENKTEFGILLASLRNKRQKRRQWGVDWSQAGVAKRLGVSRTIYNYWENGKGSPSPGDRKNIVSDFGLDETEESVLYKLAAEVPPEILELPPHNPLFTGRDAYLGQLHQLLQESGSVALTQPVSLSGLGGIGKTQLALAYAYRAHPKIYRAVFWVNAADTATLQSGYEKLAKRLKLPEWDDRDAAKRVDAVKDWLADHTNWLLVMDNADDLELARSFFPPTTNGRILLTTRSQFAGKIGARQLEIEKMEHAEGLSFLLWRVNSTKSKAEAEAVSPDVRAAASQLVTLLDGHPLALDQAGHI